MTQTIDQRAWEIVHNHAPDWLNEYSRKFPKTQVPEIVKRDECAHYCVVKALEETEGGTPTRIVLVGTSETTRPIYFRFEEKGGPVADPLNASYAPRVDAGLGFMLDHAHHEHPGLTWTPQQLIVRVLSFADHEEVARFIREDIQKRALAKLTKREREVLGL